MSVFRGNTHFVNKLDDNETVNCNKICASV